MTKVKYKGNFYLNFMNFCIFCKYFLLFKSSHFSVSNFRYKYPQPLNITVKLNKKKKRKEKMTKGILVISHIFFRFNRKF